MVEVYDVKRVDKLTYYNPKLDIVQGLNGSTPAHPIIRLRDYLESVTKYEQELDQQYAEGKMRKRIYTNEKASLRNKEKNFILMYRLATPYIQYLVEDQFQRVLEEMDYSAYVKRYTRQRQRVNVREKEKEYHDKLQKQYQLKAKVGTYQEAKPFDPQVEEYRNDVSFYPKKEGNKLPPIMEDEYINFVAGDDTANINRMEKLIRLYQYWLVYHPEDHEPVITRICMQEYRGEYLLYMQLKNGQGFYYSPKGMYDRAKGEYISLSLRNRYHNEYLTNYVDKQLNRQTEQQRNETCLQGLSRSDILEWYELLRMSNTVRIKLLREQVKKLANQDYSKTGKDIYEGI